MNIHYFLGSLPEDEKIITNLLHSIICNTLHNVKEKFAYNVPFYYKNRRICFIWPASAPLSGKTKGVTFGFCYGYLLPFTDSYMELGQRKQVSMKTFVHPQEVDIQMMKYILAEAEKIDASFAKRKK
ncbi:MAG: DUF1801 domain-containing protein [Chitinophagaceae bacterium]|nr:DUF1801 domain-containing protein [Chitinophagaceae bacterium]